MNLKSLNLATSIVDISFFLEKLELFKLQ